MTSAPTVLRVRQVGVLAGGGELAQTARDAQRSWAARRGALVVLDLGQGVVGLGEASPLPGLGADDVAAAGAALQAAAHALDGATLTFAARDAALDVVVDRARAALGGARSPAAHFALETALLDALGQLRGESMAMSLGATAEARVEVSALLGDASAAGALERARALVSAGARTLKVKVGARPVEDDVASIAALRAVVGPSIGVVADANGAWSIAQARRAAEDLADLQVALIEQPVAPELLAGLGRLAVPVWADESLFEPAARAEVLGLPHLSGVALKPTVLGGLGVVHRLAREAASRGLDVAVTHALEGPVALAACSALALALSPCAPRAGLWPHPGLVPWPLVTPHARGAQLAVWSAPGLGLPAAVRARLIELPLWQREGHSVKGRA